MHSKMEWPKLSLDLSRMIWSQIRNVRKAGCGVDVELATDLKATVLRRRIGVNRLIIERLD